MARSGPLVSIGIPTYNRAALLRRSIEAALNQDCDNIEVIVTDNASTDETQSICKLYCDQDARLKYIRQTTNRGPTENFTAAMKAASGEYFMWLGDDDWIDADYVSACLRELSADTGISLVSGTPRYYQDGRFVYTGKIFNLLHESAWRRMLAYYAKVADNGMFYGLMRTPRIQQLEIKNIMGGDWLLIAALAFTGKVKALPGVSVHRELGGATTSHRKITQTLGLSRFSSLFPMSSIAASVWMDIVAENPVYHSCATPERITAGTAAVLVILAAACLRYSKSAMRRFKNSVKGRLICAI